MRRLIAYNVHVTDFAHNEIHEGNFYTISHLFTSVANDGYARMRIKTLSKRAHVQLFTSVEGKAYVKTYSGTTYTGNGTELTPSNRNTASTNTATAKIYHTPTIDVLGTQRADEFTGSGSNPSNQIGSQGSGRFETVLDYEKDLLVELQNKLGQVADMCIIISFYEG